MNKKVLKTLEYGKIIEQLQGFAATPSGRELCRSLLPSDSYEEVLQAQTETQDALSRIFRKGAFSFRGVPDLRPCLSALELGASLGAAQLLGIASLSEISSRAKAYGNDRTKEAPGNERSERSDSHASSYENDRRNETSENEDGDLKKGDSLSPFFEALSPVSALAREIRRCILSPEEIADDASSGLKEVRRKMKTANSRIHDQLGDFINSSATRTMLQDALITMRNDRYCLPVKAEYKGSFPGMVHDQSSSSSTLFIEPMAVVKLNNELRELQLKEAEEIEKLLAELSAMAAEHREELASDYSLLCRLDFIFAKGLLAKEMNATIPVYNRDGYIHIKKGRHPLIDPKRVVPIDVYIGKDFKLLIVTGPNTGGKTVTLKTVGLFTLMGQAGLHIPALDHSSLSIFPQVYADIGDEQSIEQSLSTFSSHMTNVVSILKSADRHSLCLFDELGAGTDPTEGAALAISILHALKERRVTTLATTHYSELKLYALSTEGVENASCEFDVATLRPTYRLLIGIPGKSNAFAISQKLGLAAEIIDDAKGRINREDQAFEDVIRDLEKTRITLEREQEELAAHKKEIAVLRQRLADKNERIDQAKEKILARANEEARVLLENAKQVADDTIRKYNKWGEESGLNKEMERERTRLREELSKNEKRSSRPEKKAPAKKLRADKLHIGDAVRIVSMNLSGTVSSLPDARGRLFVQTGILKNQVSVEDLELIEEQSVTVNGSAVSKAKPQSGYHAMKLTKAANVRSELNLIGKKVDEALSLLDKYLDDAYLAHMGNVTIIHGFGTGALKSAVHNHLKSTKYVKSYHLEETNHGSTVVEFK